MRRAISHALVFYMPTPVRMYLWLSLLPTIELFILAERSIKDVSQGPKYASEAELESSIEGRPELQGKLVYMCTCFWRSKNCYPQDGARSVNTVFKTNHTESS